MAVRKNNSSIGIMLSFLSLINLIAAAYIAYLNPEFAGICIAEAVAVTGIVSFCSSRYRYVISLVFHFIWTGIVLLNYNSIKQTGGNEFLMFLEYIMLISIIIGTRFAIVNNYIAFRSSLRRTLKTEAVIIDYTTHESTTTDGNGVDHTTTDYTPRLRYVVNGMEYINLSNRSQSSAPRIGSYETIHVNPKDPDDFDADSKRYNVLSCAGYILGGIGVIIIGLIATMFLASIRYSELTDIFTETPILGFIGKTGVIEKIQQFAESHSQ
ncbi:MAG: DUF3592 domain-containing protein [Acutalibacteraceae bacterium]|nr:DUF3592 domain-containing protein [Acutalibacteraceae bacterium]